MKEKLLIHTVNEAYSFNPNQVICMQTPPIEKIAPVEINRSNLSCCVI